MLIEKLKRKMKNSEKKEEQSPYEANKNYFMLEKVN